MQSGARCGLALAAVAMLTAGCHGLSSNGTATAGVVTTELTPFGTATPTADQLARAGVILQRRISSFTRGKVVVRVDGSHLQLRADRSATPELAALISPGQLTFRRVIEAETVAQATASPCCSSWRSGDVYTPSAFAGLDCSAGRPLVGGRTDPPAREIVACSRDRSEKFHLGTAKVVGSDVESASTETAQLGQQVQIQITFTSEGQGHFTELTREAFGTTPPTNRVAIVMDGQVISAPTIEAVITDGAQITGGFTKQDADALAAVMRFGALPVSLAVSS